MLRVFSFLGMVVTVAIGMYLYSSQIKTMAPAAASGGNSKEVALITGVKNDLISIANAERGYFATEGKYASLDDLVSGKYLPFSPQHPPYTYSVETSSDGFRVTATRTTKGFPAQLWIGSDMQVQSSD